MPTVKELLDQATQINPEPTYRFQIVEKQRLQHQTTQFIVKEAIDTLGVSIKCFARLLGTDRNHVNKWRSGKLRLSAAYSGRLCYLLSLHGRGLGLNMAYSYRWENDEIRWANGKYSQGSFDDHLAANHWKFQSLGTTPQPATELANWGSGPGPTP